MAEDMELRGRIIEDRELSILFQQEGGHGVREFLPKSQIAVVHDVGGRVKVTVPLWLAKQKGLY
jgi:hypothetical protein